MQTFKEYFETNNTGVVMKKGKKYLGWKNGELTLTTDRNIAVVLPAESDFENFADVMQYDSRNARTLGRKVDLVPITKATQPAAPSNPTGGPVVNPALRNTIRSAVASKHAARVKIYVGVLGRDLGLDAAGIYRVFNEITGITQEDFAALTK